MHIRPAMVIVFLISLAGGATAQESRFPFLNPDLPLEQRVTDLVSRMTLDEKTSQMLYNAPAVERLGLPAYNWWNEALHGVARAGRATVFPQAIGLAATWDTDLMFRVATAISDEARAKYHDSIRKGRHGIYEGLTFWSPNINIFRDPRWGRGMETFGEDPYLTARLGVEFVKGMQGSDPKYFKTIATPKHFAVHSGPEPDRHVFDAVVDERDLRETYLPAFKATLVEAEAYSVMCAYNRFRGEPCCGSSELLQRILRDEWKFEGYVVSDCWAIMDFYNFHKTSPNAPHAAAVALQAGTDLNCGVTYDSLAVAVRRRLVSEALVDTAVKRLFRARFRLGMFDPPSRVPYAAIPYSTNDSKEHGMLALEATRKSIVLLKNDRNVLPLSKNLKTIAVIGPNADDVEVLLGNYNGTPSDPVTPLAGIRRKLKGANVRYARGCNVAEQMTSVERVPAAALGHMVGGKRNLGLQADYFNNQDFKGTPFVSRIDDSVAFNWWQKAPISGMNADSFGVRWSGLILPPVSGTYVLGVRVFGGFRLFIDDTLAASFSDRHVTLGQWARVVMKQGEARKIRIEYWDRRPDASAELMWSVPNPRLKEEALEATRRADAVIMVMGLSPRLEGEEMPVEIPGFKGGDRTNLDLPLVQRELMNDVVRVAGSKAVVLVLLNGSAVVPGDAVKSIPAIVEAWYPGQAAGDALADVLFGDENPGGRLPVTFYSSIDQLPPFSDYRMQGRTYRYFRGNPLYEFGYGLSYTEFAYKNLNVPAHIKAGKGKVVVKVEVQNVGRMDGDEVVQMYVSDVKASVPVPIRSLQGFKRIHLKKGETKTVRFDLSLSQLSVIDENGNEVIEPGVFEITVGGSQKGLVGRVEVE